MKRNSGIIGPVQQTSTESANGIHDIHDAHIKRLATKWPRAHLYVSLTPSVTTVVEGTSMAFQLVTEHISDGSTLYYTISTVSGTTMVDADFNQSPNDGGVDGSFTNTNDSTMLYFGLVAEQSPGDAESNVFKLQIRTGSVSGPVMIESVNITVTDAIQFGTDIRSAFYEISNRKIIDSSTSDYTGNWDVGEIQQAYAGSARIYILLKCTTSTTYVNDICVAAVQVLNSSNVIQQTWNFSTSSNNSWQTTTSAINANNSSLLSSYLTPSQAAAYSYSSMSSTNNTSRIGIASGTSSSYTGMADGISSSNTNYPVGDNQVAQGTFAYYFYREVSGATRYSHSVARSPSYTFVAGDKIRVVHAVVTSSSMSSSLNINDSLWIGVY